MDGRGVKSENERAWPTVEFRTALGFHLPVIGLLVAIEAFLVWELVFRGQPFSEDWYRTWAGVAFFLVCIRLLVRSVGKRHDPVISVGPLGVRYRYVSRDWIPWKAITAVRVVSDRGSDYIEFAVDPAHEAMMSISLFGYFNKFFRSGRYSMNVDPLDGEFEVLSQAIKDGLARTSGSR